MSFESEDSARLEAAEGEAQLLKRLQLEGDRIAKEMTDKLPEGLTASYEITAVHDRRMEQLAREIGESRSLTIPEAAAALEKAGITLDWAQHEQMPEGRGSIYTVAIQDLPKIMDAVISLCEWFEIRGSSGSQHADVIVPDSNRAANHLMMAYIVPPDWFAAAREP